MGPIRRALRLTALAWLLGQAATLSAFVPYDCCAGHRPEPVRVQAECHRTAATTHHEAPVQDDTCRMSGTCEGPVALLSVLSNHGLLDSPVTLHPDARRQHVAAPRALSADPLLIPPDSPPPRA